MPLFFFLSGIFFNPYLPTSTFILKKTDSLLKPYFGTLIIVLLFSLFNDAFSFSTGLYGVLYGNGQSLWRYWEPMWFLPHLWVIFLVSFLISKFTSFGSLPRLYQLLVLFSLLTIGSYNLNLFYNLVWVNAVNMERLTGMPFSMDLLAISVAYFLLGNTLSQQVKYFKPRWQLVVLFLLCYVVIVQLTSARLDLNKREVIDPIFTISGSMIGIYLMLSLSYYISLNKRISTILSLFGYSSLFILIFHQFIQLETYKFLKDYVWKKPKLVWAWIAFIAGISIPLLVRELATRVKLIGFIYLPFPTNQFNDSESQNPLTDPQLADQ